MPKLLEQLLTRLLSKAPCPSIYAKFFLFFLFSSLRKLFFFSLGLPAWQGMKLPLMEMAVTVELPLKGGSTFGWKVLDAASLMQWYAEHVPQYQTFLRHATCRRARLGDTGDPWHMQVHEDEVSPGNMVLGRRKVHGWYFSFTEFGLHIRNENAWLHFASLQSDFVAKVDGGFSCVTRCLYQALINKGQGYSLFRAGAPMKIGAEKVLLLNCAHPHLRRFARKSTPYWSVGA